MVTEEVKSAAEPRASVEVGGTGLRRFGLDIQEEFLPELRGVRGVRKFDEMRRNDPDIGAILTATEMSLRSLDWSVKAISESVADIEAAEFLESCMGDMSHSWADMIAEALTMFAFGWAWMEIVMKLRSGLVEGDPSASSDYDDGRIGWRKIALRGQESLQGWKYDNNGGLEGMMQYSLTGQPSRMIPIEKSVLFRTRKEKNNPEGYSLLRNAYRQYYIKSNIEEIEVIGAERDATGMLKVYIPLNASDEDKEKARDVLRKYKSDEQTGFLIPRGATPEESYEIEVVQSAGVAKVDTNAVINRCSTAIARSVLAQFLTLGTQGRGSYALSRDMKDLFYLAIKGHADNIQETINRFLVKPLFRMNSFPGITKVPYIEHSRIGQREIAPFVDSLQKLAAIGMPFSLSDWNFIRDEIELPRLSEDTELTDEEPEEDEDEEDEGDDTSTAAERWAREYLA